MLTELKYVLEEPEFVLPVLVVVPIVAMAAVVATITYQ